MIRKDESWVVVASGTLTQIESWSRALTDASVPHEIATPCTECNYTTANHAELWVEPDRADAARAAIRRVDGGVMRLW